ncbi:MAG TPA: hypothetical protein VFF65_10855 [Phycisphaerales bacterium]|nr:hypothetical protein [Phycisphaerales bacterium]
MRYFTLPASHSGAIAAVEDREQALGYWVDKPLLRQADAVVPMTVAAWSGTIIESEDAFAADVRNWSVAARSELHDKLDRLCALAVEKGVTGRLLLRPHARHVLSDWHTCARFMMQRETAGDSRTGLLVDPAAMLTEQMLTRSAEHLERTFEQVGLALRGESGRPGWIGGVVVCNLRRGDRGGAPVAGDPLGYDEGAALVACELDHRDGLLDAKLIARLTAAHLTPATPIVFVGGQTAGAHQRTVMES